MMRDAGARLVCGASACRRQLMLAAHAGLGLLLTVASLEFMVFAIRSHDTSWTWSSIAGAVFLTGAAFNGASFVAFGKSCSSLLMAGLFALSPASYVIGMYLHGRRA
jgi:hypothetical protein